KKTAQITRNCNNYKYNISDNESNAATQGVCLVFILFYDNYIGHHKINFSETYIKNDETATRTTIFLVLGNTICVCRKSKF
ncbi:hypothetical protein TSAR_009385, partial [Trichomalopsis sarcophagae]